MSYPEDCQDCICKDEEIKDLNAFIATLKQKLLDAIHEKEIEQATVEAVREAWEEKYNDLERSILDLSHPNIKMLLKKND